MRFFNTLGILFVIFISIGCRPVCQLEDAEVSSYLSERIGKEVHWNYFCQDGSLAAPSIEKKLTADDAVGILLFNNPEIQARFEEIGIVHADLIEAGLPKNPLFEGMLRFPHQRDAYVNVEFSLIQNIVDLLVIPLRTKVAKAEFKQAKLQAANHILSLVFDVERLFYSLQAEEMREGLLTTIVEINQAAYFLSKGQFEQGNINQLDFLARTNEYEESKLELSKNQIEIFRLKQKLNRLFGFRGEICWEIEKNLVKIPEQELPMNNIEEMAFSQRLDLASLYWEMDKITKKFGLTDWWVYTKANLGISTERDADGIRVTGPIYSLELPIFNYGQADRKRLYFLFRQKLEQIREKEITILSEIRFAKKQILLNRELVLNYRNKLIPVQKEILANSMLYTNTMSLSVYKLLQAKKQELIQEIQYNNALRDYWISKVDLDASLGGSLELSLKRGELCENGYE